MNKQEQARVAAVKVRIASETAFALRVYRCVYERQKPEEKFTGRHLGHDGQGFRHTETVYLNAFYEELASQDFRLTPEQADEVRERMVPYAGQFILAGREKFEERKEAERKGVGFSESYDTARGGNEVRQESRIRKLTDKEKRSIEDALERMGG